MTANTNETGLRAYRIILHDRVDEEFVAAYCPAGTQLTCAGETACLGNICTDQSGLVGLMRRLHNLGCTIVALESWSALPATTPSTLSTLSSPQSTRSTLPWSG